MDSLYGLQLAIVDHETLFQDARTLCDGGGEGGKARRAVSLGTCAQVSCYAMLCCVYAMLCYASKVANKERADCFS